METWSPLPVVLWVFALRKSLLLFQGQTPRRPFSTHSKCSTLKAKGCSRLTSEWESVWNIWGTLVCLPTHPHGSQPWFFCLQCAGDADHTGREVLQGGGTVSLECIPVQLHSAWAHSPVLPHKHPNPTQDFLSFISHTYSSGSKHYGHFLDEDTEGVAQKPADNLNG